MVPKLPRAFALDEVLTKDEIDTVWKLYRRSKRTFYKNCLDQIVLPNLDRIMAVVGPCEARFIVYGIEYRCLKDKRKRGRPRKNFASYFFDTHVARPRGRPKTYDGELDRSAWQ